MTAAFIRSTDSAPLYLLNTASDAGTVFSWAFLPTETISGDSLSPSQAWSTSGQFILTDQNLDASGPFLQALSMALSGVNRQGLKMLWVTTGGNMNPSGWTTLMLYGSQSDTTLTTTRAMVFSIAGGYRLRIPVGSTLSMSDTVLTITGSSSFIFSTRVRSITNGITLSLNGSSVGALQFSFASSGAGDFSALSFELRYFYEDPDASRPGLMAWLPYPILKEPAGGVTFNGTLDPLAVDTHTRSFLVPAASTTFESTLFTATGQRLSLTPSSPIPAGTVSARLVFSKAPHLSDGTGYADYYLCPCGAFDISGGDSVMPGLSGLELLELGAGNSHQGIFVPGQPAYTPAFSEQNSHILLNDNATTSWLYIRATDNSSTTIYRAQPKQAPLYTAPGTGYPDHTLIYQPTTANQLPATIAANCFPVVGYENAASNRLSLYQTMENAVLAPRRREIINIIAPPLLELRSPNDGTGGVLTTTPQGLLINLSDSLNSWNSVTFGNSPQSAAPDNTARQFVLNSVTGQFKSSLQSNQIFTVIANSATLLENCNEPSDQDDLELAADNWVFKPGPGTWRDDTIMIVKFAHRSLRELAADPASWTWQQAATPKDGSLQDTVQALQNIISEAEAADSAASQGSLFHRFLTQVVDDPGWNGVLVFNCPVSTKDFPPQLRGLIAGINLKEFRAHHFGVSMTPIDAANQNLTTQPSTLFGLINYVDSTNQAPDQSVDYLFRVLELKVLFENSVMANFSSKIQLQINTMFGESVLINNPGQGNSLIINGTYQRQDGQGYFDFHENNHDLFAVDSLALKSVETTKAQFQTVDPGTISSQVVSRFDFWGRMRFNELRFFDAYSYGPKIDSETGLQSADGYLTFSNLSLTMSFASDKPEKVNFTLSAGDMVFDSNDSIARSDSLVNHFPVVLSGMVQSTTESNPGSLGYISCNTPLETGLPVAPWFGLKLDLSLGSLGALAGKAGFKVNVLLAWGKSGRTGSDTIYIGLKLPGSASAQPEIPIEGVLKLSFSSIDFDASDSPAGRSYLMKFRRMALKLFLLSFPPGNTDIYLFGDPAARGGQSLGWYAAYSEDD